MNDHRWAKAGSVPFEAWHSNRGTGGKASVAGGLGILLPCILLELWEFIIILMGLITKVFIINKLYIYRNICYWLLENYNINPTLVVISP